jgi:hypothetical protein
MMKISIIDGEMTVVEKSEKDKNGANIRSSNL